MSHREREHDNSRMYWIWAADRSRPLDLWYGTLEAVIAEINARHVATGIPHACREIDQ